MSAAEQGHPRAIARLADTGFVQHAREPAPIAQQKRRFQQAFKGRDPIVRNHRARSIVPKLIKPPGCSVSLETHDGRKLNKHNLKYDFQDGYDEEDQRKNVGVKKRTQDLLDALEPAAEFGLPYAKFYLARICLSIGDSTFEACNVATDNASNVDEHYASLQELSKNQFHLMSSDFLGCFHKLDIRADQSGLQIDYRKSYDALKIGAGLGHPASQFELGESYELGMGTTQSDLQSLTWYRRSITSLERSIASIERSIASIERSIASRERSIASLETALRNNQRKLFQARSRVDAIRRANNLCDTNNDE